MHTTVATPIALLLAAISYAPSSSSSSVAAAIHTATPTNLRGVGNDNMTNAEVLTHSQKDFGQWYSVDSGVCLFPGNLVDEGNGRLALNVRPNEESVRISSNQWYSGGRLEFRVQSGAVMPGVVTSVYLASDSGRTDDSNAGSQDEIDMEWKGNDPSQVQNNVFLTGQEDLQLIDVGGDSSQTEKSYGIEWDATHVTFFIEGAPVRTKQLYRQLNPMQLHVSLWGTTGQWPGVIQWAGATDWSRVNYQTVAAHIQFLSLPN